MTPERTVPRAPEPEEQTRTERRIPRTTPRPRGGDRRGPDGAEPRRASEYREPTAEDVARLEAELEEKERRLQRVVTRYERLLNERDRRLADRDTGPPERSRLAAVRSFLGRLAARYR